MYLLSLDYLSIYSPLPPSQLLLINNCIISLIAPIVCYPHLHQTSTDHLRALNSYTRLLTYLIGYRAELIA